MVKSIIYTLVAIILSAAFFIWSENFIDSQFEEFHVAITALYDKAENGEATGEDVKAVQTLWNDKKQKLHVFLPHNDLSALDYFLSEANAYIRDGEFKAALPKIQALSDAAQKLPSAYKISFENVF